MATKRARARDVARSRGPRAFWIDHAQVSDDDYGWLEAVEQLTLWNVRLPPSFLARLRHLYWLDLRGGSAADLGMVRGANTLRYLAVNQVRGLHDVSVLPELRALRCLVLYGLPQVTTLPSLAPLISLKRADIGQMRALTSLDGLLQAPALRELLLVRKVNVTEDDVQRIVSHPTLQRFGWFPEDVPDRVWVPVVAKIPLPPVVEMSSEAWFAGQEPGRCQDL
jgi:hypothetical protein